MSTLVLVDCLLNVAVVFAKNWQCWFGAADLSFWSSRTGKYVFGDIMHLFACSNQVLLKSCLLKSTGYVH